VPVAGELDVARPSLATGRLPQRSRRGANAHLHFEQHADVWTHGDLITLTTRNTARVLGRTDGVLNIRGVRIGPAEIYNALQRVPEVSEALAVEQLDNREPGGSRLVLLLTMATGISLDRKLTLQIRRCSPRRCR
jgi:acetoacetyl-CoA synthetase